MGLKSEGFELLFANELSPMAAETFSYNYFNEDLSQCVVDGKDPLKTFWIKSKFSKQYLKKRLRENTLEEAQEGFAYNDLIDEPMKLHKGIAVGSIVDLNEFLENGSELKDAIRNGFGTGEVDLVSGGPPCQSFSMAGLREHDNAKNRLPWEFAKFVDLVRPKVALLENVTGILRAFNVEGKKFYAWFEVAKVFASLGYVPICLHVNAKYAGVAQNRPRFLMLAVREDVHKKALSSLDSYHDQKVLEHSLNFFETCHQTDDVDVRSLTCWDVEKNPEVFSNSFLSPLFSMQDELHTIVDAIDDLKSKASSKQSNYVKTVNQNFGKLLKTSNSLPNFEYRSNNETVKRRFNLYQILSKVSQEVSKEVVAYLRSEDNDLSEESVRALLKYDFRDNEANGFKKISDRTELEKHLASVRTKKLTQKALIADKPAPAALTIPDDTCHYDKNELRTLTVREMARIQSFPDNFEFRSKVTTGGKMRRFEVPQYTQVGNAVPPLLAKSIGQVIKALLRQ